ncbi:DivIVA domain-containing protein [Micromonospora sp. NPDC005161]
MRERRFKLVGLGRRGLEPDDVYAFLDRVAGDLAAVYAALAASWRETAVIKDVLRRWQSDHARASTERGPAR